MAPSAPEPVPASVRAQILATEHWGLLAVRSQTWNEVLGRISAQLMFISASLVFLALLGQSVGYTDTFRLLAIVLGLTLFLTGSLTATRVHNASQEDFLFVKGMNRLRAAYVDIDPGLERYLITGTTDDLTGVTQTYMMGPVRNVTHVAASSGIFIISINTIVASGVTAFVLWPSSDWAAAVGGLTVGVAHFTGWVYLGWRSWQVNLTPAWVRFPTGRTAGPLS